MRGIHLGNSILKRAFMDGLPLTVDKLQYLLYLVCAEYHYISGYMLIEDEFIITSEGLPYIKEVEDEFKGSKGKKILLFATDAKQGDKILFADEGFIMPVKPRLQLKVVIDNIWAKFAKCSEDELKIKLMEESERYLTGAKRATARKASNY